MVDMAKHLIFDSAIGSFKPENIVNTEVKCPFCCREKLEHVLAEDGTIILLKNKYPVLRDTLQTVIIETDQCHSELSLYPKEHLHKLFRFSMEKWQDMIASREFASVLFFKNHGPFSGGTIRHPHMQIVGLRTIDYAPRIPVETMDGTVIHQSRGAELNLAKEPKIGFCEFNVKLKDVSAVDKMADYIQVIAHYLLNHFHKRCNSYNIFFYQLEGKISAKIMPRLVTSPIFIGYSIPQVSSRGEEVIKEIQKLYF
jgi:galactose-1-phosphate uridylyltransferase